MPRKQGNTRTLLIAAAYKVLAQKGYEATSIKEIAREAGVAPGLIHYHFANKEELLLAVLQEASSQYTQQMRQVPPGNTLAAGAEAALTEPRDRVGLQPEWYKLRYELFALGLRTPSLLPGVASLLATGRQGIGQVVQRVVGDRSVDHGVVAAVLLACFDGLALQKLADPEFDLDGAYRILYQMALRMMG